MAEETTARSSRPRRCATDFLEECRQNASAAIAAYSSNTKIQAGYNATYYGEVDVVLPSNVGAAELLLSNTGTYGSYAATSNKTISIQAAIQHPPSRGSVKLNSTSVFDAPNIDQLRIVNRPAARPHGLYMIRHSSVEQNSWADIIGDDRWNFDNVWPYMRKSEYWTPSASQGISASGMVNVEANHGLNGSIHFGSLGRVHPQPEG